jgi:hypothetical protein
MTRILEVLTQTIEVVRTSYSAPDAEGLDYGHGTESASVVGTYRGLIQPRSAGVRERATSTGEGATVGRYVAFLEAAAIGNVDVDDVIRKAPVNPGASLAGDYRILFVANAAGWDHHLELDLDRVEA